MLLARFKHGLLEVLRAQGKIPFRDGSIFALTPRWAPGQIAPVAPFPPSPSQPLGCLGFKEQIFKIKHVRRLANV